MTKKILTLQERLLLATGMYGLCNCQRQLDEDYSGFSDPPHRHFPMCWYGIMCEAAQTLQEYESAP